MSIVQLSAGSRYRLRVLFTASFPGIETAATYTLTREDGAGTVLTVTRAWLADPLAVELALSAPLLDGTVYILTVAGVGTGRVAWFEPVSETVLADEPDDPEAEAFGIDIDWLAPALDAGRDLPEVRGLACLRHDLAAIAITEPGELFHHPEAGAGAELEINGADVAGETDELRGRVRRQWLSDDRVLDASIQATVLTDGTITLDAAVRTVAIEEPVQVTVE